MSDPHQEPENSTVDDWTGQEVSEDEELADQALEETGDESEAEKVFEEKSHKSEHDS